MTNRSIIPLALALLAGGLSCAPLHAQVSRWAGGCYDLSLGPWEPAVDLRGDTLYVAPPPRIQFDTVPYGGSLRDRLHVRPAPGSPPSIHTIATWMPVGDDSIRIAWSNGFSGLVMRLRGDGEELRGEAMPVWDSSSGPPQTARVTARRVACDAPLPPEHASWRRFPRSVPLASGATLTLHEPLPGGALPLEVERRRVYRVRERPVGLFSGATHVRVTLARDSVVDRIEVHYPPDQDFDALVESLAAALGAPTGDSRRASGPRSVRWTGRDSRLGARQTTLAGSDIEVRITLYR